jgi:hypothetical protein
MTIKEVKKWWIQEINEGLERINMSIKETSIMKVYDASKERGMSRKLWLIGEGSDGKTYYYYMYITKKGKIRKYNGSVYANNQNDFEEDIKDYEYLGKVL